MFAQRPSNPIAMPARIIYLCLNKSTDDDVNDSMATGCSVEKLFWGQKERNLKRNSVVYQWPDSIRQLWQRLNIGQLLSSGLLDLSSLFRGGELLSSRVFNGKI
jgi:hypothetical protein